MFVHMKKIPGVTANALDLIIEFATLGEYGLEYPEGSRPSVTEACGQERRRILIDLKRNSNTTLRRTENARIRASRPSRKNCPAVPSGHQPNSMRPGTPQTGNPAFASALRPPRIKLSFTD